jgi:hypothetical protein
MKHEILEEALSTIRAAGFEPSIVRNRHWKISWIDRRGRKQVLTVAASPSDYRARVQSRALLRRLLAHDFAA